MKLGTREIAFLVVLAAVPLAAWFFVFQPRNEEIASARKEIATMEGTLAELDRVTRELGDVRSAIDDAEARLADFRRYVPDAEEVAVLLNDMDRIADTCSLELPQIRRAEENQTQGYREIPLSMEARGGFEGVYEFMSSLERLPRIIRVQSLDIERNLTRGRRGEDDRPVGDLDVAMTLLVYCEGEDDR